MTGTLLGILVTSYILQKLAICPTLHLVNTLLQHRVAADQLTADTFYYREKSTGVSRCQQHGINNTWTKLWHLNLT